MTSEVVLMNRGAVAMAADSAVTISGANYLKTYNSVDKLFPLVEGQPIAVMIYNNAEIMSTPWETVISLYREHAAGKAMDTVDAYAQDFLNFISGNPELFPPDHQDTEFFKHVLVVYTILAQDFDFQIQKFIEAKAGRVRDHVNQIFEFVIDQLLRDYDYNLDETPRGELDAFPQGMSEQIRRRYKDEINELIDALVQALAQDYPGLHVTDQQRAKLTSIAVHSVTRDAFFEHFTGVVFAGFGRQDKYPSMRSYLCSSVVLGLLKHRQDRNADMGSESGPVVQPFAQDRMIRTFLTGMDGYLRMFMFGETLKMTTNITSDLIARVPGLNDEQRQTLWTDYSENNLIASLREFFHAVDSYQYQVHTLPIYRAIQSLPKRELGETAASLIKLNSFQQKVMNSIETVGGPIDVAVITRNGGLEWRTEKAEL